ncbi:hypothetical protein BSL78_14721 [Apostichopus japonicus]|uniref:Fibronectin type-III domain-containing protein n=1 Tax=Stichopus japonicus TaxID=307972 RepID=A0A2G8KKC9_STIJA|nr:hypothetical protein BSL78_14721 [Apostichopus japonicus]
MGTTEAYVTTSVTVLIALTVTEGRARAVGEDVRKAGVDFTAKTLFQRCLMLLQFTVVEEGIQVSWNLWRPGYDYGTGPVDSYRVNFGLTNISTEQQERTHEDTINNYLTLTGLDIAGYYSINVSVIKIIQRQRAVGQSSPSAVVCMSTAPPTNVTAEPTRAEEISFTVSWEDICPSTEFTYDVYYRPATGDGSDSVQTVQSERSVTITNGLLQCTEYLVSVRRNAEGSSRDRSAEATVLTDSEGFFLNFTHVYNTKLF